VRNIDLWACRAKAGAAELEMRLKHDPLWPRIDEPLAVTFHGEEEVVSSGSVCPIEIEEKLRTLCDPRRSKESLTALNSRTVVRFSPATGQTIAYSYDAPTLDDIAERLRSMQDRIEQKSLVMSFMAKCMAERRPDDLRKTLERFPDLADPNGAPPANRGGTLVETAAYFGWLDVLDVLLSHPTTQLEGSRALRRAASEGQVAAVERLLAHPQMSPAQVADARERAIRFEHAGVLAALEKWQPRSDTAVVKDDRVRGIEAAARLA